VLASGSSGVRAQIAPLLHSEHSGAWRSFADLFDTGAVFTELGHDELCAFAIVRLADSAYGLQTRFALQFHLPLKEPDADARDDAVNSRLLESVDPRALIFNILRGLPVDSGGPGRNSGKGSISDRGELLQRLTIERVMEACTADATRIEQVDTILRACSARTGMESFVAFWNAFKAAVQEVDRVRTEAR
jgi:hypothetical protein